MASSTLYPPIVSPSEPAFIADSTKGLEIYFSFSSLSEIPSSFCVHASIMRKDGVKVLNTLDDPFRNRYRATGIILNLIPIRVSDNYYKVVIENNDLKSKVDGTQKTYEGFIPGWVYKVQLRLSTAFYDGTGKQEAWIQTNSSNFSEWSTICYTKAISKMDLQIPLFNYNSKNNNFNNNVNTKTTQTLTSVDLFGSLSSSDPIADEEYSSIEIFLYKNNNLIEKSGEIFKTELSSTYFSYKFKTKFIHREEYKVEFTYVTENGYKPDKPLEFFFMFNDNTTDRINAYIITADNDLEHVIVPEECEIDIDPSQKTSVSLEEDEGRIGIKIYSDSEEYYSGNICISRSSMKDNFAAWEDIKIITLKKEYIRDYPIIYDYTVESGVWYKYAIQSISHNGERGKLVEMDNPIRRIFTYSFLLGQDDKQLKLNFDNTMNSFKHQIYDSKTDTIGSKYPFINRNAIVNYRMFPINGLISFWMDENKTFLQNGKLDIYEKQSIVDLYDEDNTNRGIFQYDHTYERDFREIILDFLQDGKPKLFKSPTEGNIIVRLMDVNCTPNQTLDRMIYSFSSNANEIDDAIMSNYLKYGFYNPGTYSTSLEISTITHLGQIDGEFKVGEDNIFKLIYEKYDSQGKNTGGYTFNLETIERVRITINDPPLRLRNNAGELVIGNNFELITGGNALTITIYDPRGMYEFDSLIKFTYGKNGGDSLIFLGDEEGTVQTVNATIDFLYTISTKLYIEHEIEAKTAKEGIGEFFEEVEPGTSILNQIYYKYYFETEKYFRYLKLVSSIEIEANPHTVFGIKDENDNEIEYHEVGDTGVLNLYELNNITKLIYIGKRYETEMYNDSSLSNNIITEDTEVKDAYGNTITIKAATDVRVIYRYVTLQGTYKNE